MKQVIISISGEDEKALAGKVMGMAVSVLSPSECDIRISVSRTEEQQPQAGMRQELDMLYTKGGFYGKSTDRAYPTDNMGHGKIPTAVHE